jgi:hypothetical protein
MKKWMIVTAGTMCMITGYPSFAQRNAVTCTGILVEVDMNPRADFPMAVIYDNTDMSATRTCVLDVGHAGHWPLRGACEPGEKCRIIGPYFKKIGNTYYMRQWDKVETPH